MISLVTSFQTSPVTNSADHDRQQCSWIEEEQKKSLNNGLDFQQQPLMIIKFVQDILSASSNNISNEKLQIGSSTMGALTVKKNMYPFSFLLSPNVHQHYKNVQCLL